MVAEFLGLFRLVTSALVVTWTIELPYEEGRDHHH